MKLAVLSTILALLAAPALPDPVKATIEGGVMVGTETATADIYRNIPYAAPPVAPLRWAPPAKVVPWTGERDGTKAGVSCMQTMRADGAPNFGSANGPMSEDCLQLNVFAPKGAKKAPVMVWLHGGSHRFGAGWIYDGSNFARDGVVLVSINYRLGPLGYFAHPALTKAAGPGEAVGNYGLMDQIAALEWVKRNIKTFGGDPSNVTLFGESAGGGSTLALLATRKSRGLYQKVVVQSGGGWGGPTTLADKEVEGVKGATALGLTNATADQLRAAPAADLIAKVDGNFGPFVDGRLMKETPAQAFASGRANDVPLIIGSNSGEDSLMGEFGLPPAAVGKALPADMRAVYAEEAAQGDDVLGRAAFTDRVMGAPARWTAAQASKGKPAWLYYFSYVGSRFRPLVTRSFHAAEIQYVFEYWGRRTPLSMIKPDDQAMATLMHGCWVAFAKTGKPACDWPAYQPKSDQLMEFGAASGVRTHFRKARLDAQEVVALPTLELSK